MIMIAIILSFGSLLSNVLVNSVFGLKKLQDTSLTMNISPIALKFGQPIPKFVTAGAPYEISGKLALTYNGLGVGGKTVTFSSNPSGITGSTITSSGGQYSIVPTGPNAGTYIVIAQVLNDKITMPCNPCIAGSSAKRSLTVMPGSLPGNAGK
jgi:hypothetical protein